MKINFDKWLIIGLITSILSIIIGYFLWDILIPIQDYNLSTDEQLRAAQKEAAINYPLGGFLLHLGFIGLAITTLGYLWRFIHSKRQK
ncbi:hypothetical protein FEZ48_00530 [Marinilactibacillus psychrotolerans]|uniref:Uncharacterized protein n=1 Tax=Marinilactibacillus psychrotolerans TaxID=191770 RepID=A0A5R9C8N3_9LACT|nr:hypothetical protein [Marinilactibacillus psychrotolerans]TLQ09666.1 hypothetical protein FEZ48_00530 [Marinilactibacillus psychrotolerans]